MFFLTKTNWNHAAEYGKTLALRIVDPDFPAFIAKVVKTQITKSMSDGIMLDWWINNHGSGYSKIQVAKSREDTAKAICDALLYVNPDLILVLLSGSKWADIAKSMGIKVALEVFADRAVEPDGTLVSRSKEGSVIHDADMVVERSIKMIKDGKVEAIDGSIIEYEADTICLHGDTPGAVEMAKKLNTEFGNQGIEITKLKQIINE